MLWVNGLVFDACANRHQAVQPCYTRALYMDTLCSSMSYYGTDCADLQKKNICMHKG